MLKHAATLILTAAMLLAPTGASAVVVDDVEQAPAADRPQYLGENADVYGIDHVGDRVVVAGTGITSIRNGDGSVRSGANLSATAPGDPTRVSWVSPLGVEFWDIEPVGDGHDFIAVGEGGAYRFDLTTNTLEWQLNLGGTATTISRIPGTPNFIVGGDYSPALKVVRLSGRINAGYSMPAVTGTVAQTTSTKVYRGDINPQGTRYVFIGSFSDVGGAARQQAAMLDIGPKAATVAGWAPPILTADPDGDGSVCASRFPAYLRSVDYAPDGSWFVLGSTGGPAGRACDTAMRFNGARNRPAWVDETCGDTIHSVHVTDDGQHVLVGGHFKCIGQTRGTQGSPGQFDRYGMAMLNADGTVSAWKSDKCRGVGARVIASIPGGYGVGYDCTYWGNSESENPDPSPKLPLARFAFLAS
jgi:hypothetical protein